MEHSRSAIDKLRLYAAIAVPEFWCYNVVAGRDIYFILSNNSSTLVINPNKY
ncbi:MAG: hypothetical protein V7L05_02330 [Nostoc sp.]|uniref:hypothetical protein n=1 Tax=Nostoc sp. TaxID=1180 RepID=UPI002FF50135